jgi:hypothetical protein
VLHLRQSARLEEMGKSNENFAITGSGLVCSLGTDVDNACAAARAGITRAVHLDYFEMTSSEGALETAVGHPVPFLAEGFEDCTRLLRLARGALADLSTHSNSACPNFYLSLPDPNRCFTGTDLIADPEIRNSINMRTEQEDRDDEDADQEQDQPGFTLDPAHLLKEAAKLASWRCEPQLRFVSFSGRTGVAEALNAALADLRTGTIQHAIVGGVDSLLDEDTLNWLDATGRLKSSTVPAGLQPGEGAAFLLVEGDTHSSTKAKISAINLASEAQTLLLGSPATGRGLAEALAGVLRTNGEYCPWILSDLNGEPFAASDWGQALVQLRAKGHSLDPALTSYAAACFGETGAASGALSMCVAAKALERNYAPLSSALVVNSSDGCGRSAILLDSC